MKVVFGDVLRQHTRTERITNTASETFVTLRLNAKGAIKRNVGEGKTPQPFTGYRVTSGQFIYSRIDARNGAFAIIPKSLDGAVVSKDFPVFDIDRSKVDPRFLLMCVGNKSFVDGIRTLSFGATNRQRVKEEVFLNLRLELPPLDEQRRIAAILDKADDLRTKRREALAHLDTLTQSIFHSMFGDPESSWPELTIEDLADRHKGAIRTGPFGSQLLTSEFTDEGIAVIGIDNAVSNQFAWKERRYISPEKYQTLRRYTVRPGDLLVTIMGTLGRCAVVPSDIPPAINTKHLCCITLNRKMAVPEWLHSYFLRSDAASQYLRQTTKGAIMGGLNMGIIKKMPVLLPPLELQHTFANRVAAVERLKELHRKHLTELDVLFVSLQHRAFRGEL
ncbi:restriction endonuclease subunit S [Pseudarthrobacter sp. NamE2]|uniref:restriction endonuclease subunit S n=1 Tax=Pseudarthrobacter sp. NamE2 TaxID=2576838 RepID=UPI0010FD306C|nr:restriction endonuclease subunit S [Pseudarthrobacter sp. NamE2]TLM84012.1 restriction endonuclease subunit S [Pseudarthrobacter sp. NamE2]